MRPVFRAVAIGLVAAPLPALAQETPKADAIIGRVCAPRPGQAAGEVNAVSQMQLAEATLAEANVLPSDFADAADPTLPYRAAIYAGMNLLARDMAGQATEEDEPRLKGLDANGTIRGALQNLNLSVNTAGGGLIVAPATGRPIALFMVETPGWTLSCKPPKPSPGPAQTGGIDTEVEKIKPGQAFAIRQKPEELGLTGKKARAAGGFGLAFSRTQTAIATGGRKTDTKFSIDGTVGVRLTPTESISSAYLYGRYQLERARTRPAPVLAPGASQSDGDTDVLELGTTGTLWLNTDKPVNFAINGQLSGVFDFANDSQRAKAKVTVTPGFDLRDGAFPLCGIGKYQEVSGELTARCGLQFEAEAAHVFKAGTAKIGAQDLFIAAGGKLSYELFLPTDDGGSGVVAGVSYRYLPVLQGALGDIERLEAQLKHRFWTEDKLGIEVGFSYSKGTNELSFEEEDLFKFGLGIIF